MEQDYKANGKRSIVVSTIDKELNNETSRAIRKVMEVIERYTDYDELEADRKAIVRDTVLNQINRLVRVAKHKQTISFNRKE